MLKRLLLLICLLPFAIDIIAQIYCYPKTINVSSCTSASVTLRDSVKKRFAQTQYKIDSIPFKFGMGPNCYDTTPGKTPYRFPNDSGVNNQGSYRRGVWDKMSTALPIGFKFCFFNKEYTQFYIGVNGWIGFSPNQNTTDPMRIIPDPTWAPLNCIMGPWTSVMLSYPQSQDVNCIRYATYGTAPNRRLVVDWGWNYIYHPKAPKIVCSAHQSTWMHNEIVIYEGTNIIENYIDTLISGNEINKGGKCYNIPGIDKLYKLTQGIHDPTGTVAYTVPGRNYEFWSADEDARRWTPSGNASSTTTWWDGNTQIGTGDSVLNVVVTGTKKFVARVIYTTCPPDTLYDTLTVNFTKPNCILVGPPRTICEKDTAYLWAGGGNSYKWSPNTALSNINIYNPIASPVVTTTYTVTAYDAGSNAVGTATQVVNVKSLPAADAGSNKSICLNNSTTLTASGGGTYLWSNNQTTQSITVNPTTNSTYNLTVTSNGCTATDFATVTINPLPTPTVTAPVQICPSDQATLTAGGGTQYLWDNNAGTNATINVTPAVNTTYNVTVTDINGCSNTTSTSVTISSVMIPTVNSDSICIGNPITITVNGGSTYKWNDGSTTKSITVSPTTNTSYQVTAATGNCSGTAEAVVTVNPLPLVDAGNNVTICNGQSTTLTAMPNNATSYVWDNNANNVQNPLVSPALNTTFNLTVTDANSCSATDNVTVNVIPLPAIDAQISLSNICNNTTPVTVSVVVSNPSGNETYNWSDGSTTQTTASFNTTPSINTTYNVTVTNNSCTAADTVSVRILAPTANAGTDKTICLGTSTELEATSVGGTQFIWEDASNSPRRTVSPNTNTTYIVTVSNSIPCSAVDTVVVYVTPAPVVDFSADRLSGCEPLSVGFTDMTNPTGDKYSWYFNDVSSTTVGANIPNPSHTFQNSGNYSITLAVANSIGCESRLTKSKYILVYPKPVASFYPNPAVGNSENPIEFINESQNGTSYLWDFGDIFKTNNTSKQKNPTHLYVNDKDSAYTVKLVVSSKDDCKDSVENLVRIKLDFYFYAPNAFVPYPNGTVDENKKFIPKQFNLDESYFDMKIFNRWGELVYSCDSWEKPWDGKDPKGSVAPIDTYVWVVMVKEKSGRLHKYIGRVSLLN